MDYMEPYIVDLRAAGTLVTVATVREHLNLFEDTSYDTLLAGIINAATTNVEDYLGEFLAFTSVTQPFRGFYQELPLVHNRILSIDSIQYRSTDGTMQTVAPSVWVYDNTAREKSVRLARGQQWPSDLDDSFRAPVSVNYSAEWEDAPEVIVQAILLTCGDLFENRNNSTSERLTTVPLSVRHLIAPHVTRRF